MHPEILRELSSQRGREMRARAHQANLARMASRAQRAARRGHGRPNETDRLVMPPIPDYVDGTFRVTSSADEKADSQPGQVPAARHAA